MNRRRCGHTRTCVPYGSERGAFQLGKLATRADAGIKYSWHEPLPCRVWFMYPHPHRNTNNPPHARMKPEQEGKTYTRKERSFSPQTSRRVDQDRLEVWVLTQRKPSSLRGLGRPGLLVLWKSWYIVPSAGRTFTRSITAGV